MTEPQRIHLRIERLSVDGAVDPDALRAAISAQLHDRIAGTAGASLGAVQEATAQRVAQRVHGALPPQAGRSGS